jgi:flagellar assembly protein FliH
VALEKPIIKADIAGGTTFDYKPREFATGTTSVARNYVDEDAFRSPDFKISELVSKQAGISQLESEAHQDKINNQVLARLGEVQERAYHEGYELGLIEGTEKAFQEAKVDLTGKMNALESVLRNIEEIKKTLLIDNEAEFIKLVFEVAKRIALRDIEGNREAVLEMIQNVVGEAQADEKIVVHLSTEDHYFLETLQDKSGQRIESLERVKFISEDNVKSGGCLIETEYGSVDATVEERVERVWQTLLAKIPQHAPGIKKE